MEPFFTRDGESMGRKGIIVFSVLWLCAASGVFGFQMLKEIYPQSEAVAAITCEEIEMPLLLEDSGLLAMNYAVYEGPFEEDGTGDAVSNVTALVIQNTGTAMVKEAAILLRYEGGELLFRLSCLPPGATVLVPEANRSTLRPDAISSLEADAAMQTTDMWPGLSLRETGLTELELRNDGEERLRNIKLYYKNYDTPSNMYIGGVSYCFCVAELAPGQTVTVQPYHYVMDYSKIVAVTAEQENGVLS